MGKYFVDCNEMMLFKYGFNLYEVERLWNVFEIMVF